LIGENVKKNTPTGLGWGWEGGYKQVSNFFLLVQRGLRSTLLFVQYVNLLFLQVIIAPFLETCSFILENDTNVKNKTAPTRRRGERERWGLGNSG